MSQITQPSSHLLTPILIISSLIVWSCGIYIYLYYPVLLIDDAYIYLHIASNILDVGTAQYYPISGNESLLASSPLRMLILVPATALARVFTATDYSVFTSQLTFIFSGFLTTLLFLPWFWGKWHWFWAGVFFTGLVNVATAVTMWQMEGTLLFWCLYTLAWLAVHQPLSTRTIGQIGFISGLLMLSRPEYGVVALFIGYISLIFSQHRWSWLLAYTTSLLMVALTWIVIATLLKVWFIPTSYLTKIITGKLDFFGVDFGELLPQHINFYFFHNSIPLDTISNTAIWIGLIVGFSLYGLLLSRQHRFYFLFFIGFTLLTALLYGSPGNYLWYNENYVLALMTIGFFVILRTVLQQQKHYLLTAISLIFIVSFTIHGVMERLFNLPHSYIEKNGIYADIAKHHQGNGLFQFPDLPVTYVSMMEIGVVSYLAGSTVWLNDMGGLAQAATLKGTHESRFSLFYPPSLLIHANAENKRICQQAQMQPCTVHDAWAFQQVENPEQYVYRYYPQYKFGLNSKPIPIDPPK